MIYKTRSERMFEAEQKRKQYYKDKASAPWSKWFAWYPVPVEFGGFQRIVWLQHVERKYHIPWNGAAVPKYRLLGNE